MELSEKVMTIRNITNLNTLPEDIFVQMLEAVILYLCKTPVDPKDQHNVKSNGTKCDIAKNAFVDLSCLLVEAARHDFDKETLKKLLNTSLIVDHRVDKLCHSYANNKQEIQMQLQLIGNNLGHIVDTDWRLSHCIKYGFQSSIESFQYHVRFTTKEYAEIKYVTFTCTLQQLQELLGKIKDAIRHLEKIPTN
ncbi:COMM domain-containing protein 3-like [Polistes fuscatus]|uniref:COMM domain-containing protein 3-like n=1 Tax=Polistes fuscatus TaxID=30207 RepID=UPI001CA95E23|nr:COMM domain-containing protein 3-like [Polistes fuscatus]